MRLVVRAAVTALNVVGLVLFTLGIMILGGVYFLLHILERAGEYFTLLPRGWGTAHDGPTLIVAAIAAAPALIYLLLVVLRIVYRYEQGPRDQVEPPPESRGLAPPGPRPAPS